MRCPEALTKLDGVAAQFAVEAAAGKVMFATVNIDDKAKGAVIVAEKCVRLMMMWWCLVGVGVGAFLFPTHKRPVVRR